jgi:hypothetical protein
LWIFDEPPLARFYQHPRQVSRGEKDKKKAKNKDVASTVPAESDQMNLVVGAFRERVESINGDATDGRDQGMVH